MEQNLYEVKTYNDCEGRTTRLLGIYRGNVQDIALHLADKAVYHLLIKPISIQEAGNPTRKTVEVHFSGFGSESEELVNTELATKYHSVYIGSGEVTYDIRSKQELDEMKRREALSKLSSEEKALLGLGE